MEKQDIKLREKEEIQERAEQTRPGLVFSPAVDIFENEMEITLLADMPGVTGDSLEIDLRDNELTITAHPEVQHGEKERGLLREYEVGDFKRVFSVSDRIDQGKISGAMKDGVLRLVLPKAEKAKPRRIKVESA